MIFQKCKGRTKKGKPCKKDAVLITGQCVKHWYMGYLAGEEGGAPWTRT